MKTKVLYEKLIWIAIILLFAILIYKIFTRKIETFQDNKSANIEIVVARYNEKLDWLKNEPFNKHPVTIYNKGINDDFYKASNIKNVVQLENVGRCDHTYIYHIIENYDNLAEVTVFLPGSTDMQNKLKKATQQIVEVEKNNNTVFIGSKYPNGVKTELYDFVLDNWKASYGDNKTINSEQHLQPASIRPFGKWFEQIFPNIHIEYVSYFGILGISRKHIIQHPKSYYKNLIQELNGHSNPEVGHYFERSWNAVFYPLDGAIFIQ